MAIDELQIVAPPPNRRRHARRLPAALDRRKAPRATDLATQRIPPPAIATAPTDAIALDLSRLQDRLVRVAMLALGVLFYATAWVVAAVLTRRVATGLAETIARSE